MSAHRISLAAAGKRVAGRRLQARTSVWLAHRVLWLYLPARRTRGRRRRR